MDALSIIQIRARVHRVDPAARQRLFLLVEEVVCEPGARQACREAAERDAVRVVFGEGVRFEEEPAEVVGRAHDAVECAAALDGVRGYEREWGQGLFGGLGAGDGVRWGGVGAGGYDVVGCSCDAGGGCAV